MVEENNNKDPVTYTEEDLKKMEEDVKKATGEGQRKQVEEALDKAKLEMSRQKEVDELKRQQREMQEKLDKERAEYAQKMEQLKKDAEDNAKRLIDELRNERQSVVNTNNPFKKEDGVDAHALLKKRLREDPEFAREVDKESAKVFLQSVGLNINALY